MSAAKEPIRSSGRSRTPIEHYNPSQSSESDENTDYLAVGKGKGLPLGELASFTSNLNKYNAQDDLLIYLHRLLYGSAGKSTIRKRNLRQFQGYVYNEQLTKDKIEERLNDRKWTAQLLRELSEWFGIEKSGDKASLIDRIVTFLSKPNGTKVSKDMEKKKRKAGKPAKESASKKTKKAKRPLSAFFLFSKDLRPKIKKENPDFGITDIAKELGTQWRALSAAKKKPYEQRAAELKKEYDAAKFDEDTKELKAKKSTKSESTTKSRRGKRNEVEEEESPDEPEQAEEEEEEAEEVEENGEEEEEADDKQEEAQEEKEEEKEESS